MRIIGFDRYLSSQPWTTGLGPTRNPHPTYHPWGDAELTANLQSKQKDDRKFKSMSASQAPCRGRSWHHVTALDSWPSNLPLTATSGRAFCPGHGKVLQSGDISVLRPINVVSIGVLLLGNFTGTAPVHLSLHPSTAWPSPSPPAWDYTLYLIDPCDSSACNFNYGSPTNDSILEPRLGMLLYPVP